MSHYAKLISAATGVTAPADLEEIEDYMRNLVWRSTLDWQTRAQLEASAVVAWNEVQMVRRMLADPTLAPDSLVNDEAFQFLLSTLDGNYPTKGANHA